MCRVLIRLMVSVSVVAVVAFCSYRVGVRRGYGAAEIERSFDDGFFAGERNQRYLNIFWNLFLYDRCSKLAEGIGEERWKASGLPKDSLDRLKISIAAGMRADAITLEDVLNKGNLTDEMREKYRRIIADAEESATVIFPAAADISWVVGVVPSIPTPSGKSE